MKSGSRKMYVLLILSFPVYRCHGQVNSDLIENYMTTNFNPNPVTVANFTSIRLREELLKAN